MENQVPDPLIGQVVDNRYEVLQRIATGGMATVFLARDRRLDREIALKVMHPHLAQDADFVARFRREARSAAKLAHPGVVAVHDQGQDGRVVYLAMEYVEGQTLRDLLNQLGALTLDEAFDVLGQVLAALGAAHEAGLVHRDVKPENVLVTANGIVKVADFGVARAVGDSTTSTGTVMGTVAYLSPELLTLGVADARTDVYAAGILLYEMITGSQPFTGSSPIQVAYQHVHDDIPAPSGRVGWVPPEVDRLVATLAARTPDGRPATAREAAVLLGQTAPYIDRETSELRASASSDGASHTTQPAGSASHAPTEPTTTTAAIAPTPPDEPSSRSFRRSRKKPTAATTGEPQSASALSPAIEQASDEPPKKRRRKPLRRFIIIATIIALILALAGGGTFWYLKYGPGSYTSVPITAGKTLEEAKAAFKNSELRMKTSEVFSTEVEAGRVISSDPPGKASIAKGGTVALVLSKGPDYRAVPPVITAAEADARAAIELAGLVYAEDERLFSEEVGEGFVISQEPAPDAQAIAGDAVHVVISKGREPFPIPEVVGLASGAASQAIKDAGFGVRVAEEFSDTIENGVVISQKPTSDATGFRNDTVTIIVSKGQDLVTVPDVVRMGTVKAVQTLEAAGLTASYSDRDTFFNLVRSQDPKAGTPVKRGSAVTLTIL